MSKESERTVSQSIVASPTEAQWLFLILFLAVLGQLVWLLVLVYQRSSTAAAALSFVEIDLTMFIAGSCLCVNLVGKRRKRLARAAGKNGAEAEAPPARGAHKPCPLGAEISPATSTRSLFPWKSGVLACLIFTQIATMARTTIEHKTEQLPRLLLVALLMDLLWIDFVFIVLSITLIRGKATKRDVT
jgi:hypothetical protein